MNCLLGAPEPHTFTWVPSSMRETWENRLLLPGYCLCLYVLFTLCVSRWISVSELITFGLVCLVNECWQHVAIFYAEVVIGTEHVGRDDCCVTMTVLLKVCPVNKRTMYRSDMCNTDGHFSASIHVYSSPPSVAQMHGGHKLDPSESLSSFMTFTNWTGLSV